MCVYLHQNPDRVVARFEFSIHLTTLHYSADNHGSLRVYIYDYDGYHTGGQWFTRETVEEARGRVRQAIAERREVRITNSGDFLVFDAQEGKVCYPPNPEIFWETASMTP